MSKKQSKLFNLDICWIGNSSHEQDKPSEIVVYNQQEWAVEGNSRRDGEIQHDVVSPPF